MIPMKVKTAILDACVGHAVSPNDVLRKRGKRPAWEARRRAMQDLRAKGCTFGQIARWWGVSQQSVWELVGEKQEKAKDAQ